MAIGYGCEIHFASPKKLWNDDSPANANKQWFQPWFQSGAKWILSIHSMGSLALYWDPSRWLSLAAPLLKPKKGILKNTNHILIGHNFHWLMPWKKQNNPVKSMPSKIKSWENNTNSSSANGRQEKPLPPPFESASHHSHPHRFLIQSH